MITTSVIPASTAGSQELLIEITEKLCHQYCVNEMQKPIVTVAFSQGEATVLNGNAIIPITATITAIQPSHDGRCVVPEIYAERFEVAFDATTTNVTTLTAGADSIVTPAYVSGCKAKGFHLTTTLTIAIRPPFLGNLLQRTRQQPAEACENRQQQQCQQHRLGILIFS